MKNDLTPAMDGPHEIEEKEKIMWILPFVGRFIYHHNATP